jgi:hypothetical protein
MLIPGALHHSYRLSNHAFLLPWQNPFRAVPSSLALLFFLYVVGVNSVGVTIVVVALVVTVVVVYGPFVLLVLILSTLALARWFERHICYNLLSRKLETCETSGKS